VTQASLSPVQLEVDGDLLKATLSATSPAGETTRRVVAHLLADGQILDLQSTSLGGWSAGTTGDPDLDARIISALEHAYIAAKNAAALVELVRRGRHH
jgi:hypothetical protein